MSDPSWTDITTAIGTAVTAVGTLVLAAAAVLALTSWELANQRAEECVSAGRDLQGAIGRFISLRGKTDKADDASRAMWDSSRRFDQAFTAARRYHRTLKESTAREIMEILTEFGKIHGPLTGDALEKAKLIKSKIDDLLAPIYKL
jgi:hypothetical protein